MDLTVSAALDPSSIAAIVIAVTGLTQLVKWMGLPDTRGPLAVLGIAFLGIMLWGWSKGALARESAFDFFSGWILVATSSAGVFGFTRAVPSAVTAAKAPPGGGAGSSPTAKLDPYGTGSTLHVDDRGNDGEGS